MQSRCYMIESLKASLPTAQGEADLPVMHCQDSHCAEHPLLLGSNRRRSA